MSVPGRFRLLITMLIAEKSGMPLIKRDVRFGSKADLRTTTTERPLCANSGHSPKVRPGFQWKTIRNQE
jgi:hypothetical protein